MPTQTKADFARRHDVHRGTVTKWEAKGLLVLTPDGLVDVEATEWNLDQRPETYRGGKAHRPIRSTPEEAADPRERPPRSREPPTEPGPARQPIPQRPGDPDDRTDDYDPDAHDLPTAQAIRRKENFLGLYRRQEVLKNDRTLVDRLAANAEFFEQARQNRDSWLAWPARVAIPMAEEIKVDPVTGKVDYRVLTTVLATFVRQHLAEMGEPDEPEWKPAGRAPNGGPRT